MWDYSQHPVAVGPDLARIRSSSSPSRQAGARGSSAAPRWRSAGRREHDAARRRGSGRSPGESVRRAASGTSTVVSCDTMASTSRMATCRAPRRTAKLGRSLSVPTARPERSGAGDEAGRDDRAPELFGGAVAELFIRLTAGVVGDVAVEWRYAAMLQRNAWLLRSRACLSMHRRRRGRCRR